MKIAYIVEPRKVIGGGVRAAMNLAKCMKKRFSAEASIFGVYDGTVEDEEVDFKFVYTLQPISLTYWKSLKCFLREYNPDIVHCLGLYSSLVCVLMRKMMRADYKIVCTVHRVTMNMRFAKLNRFVNGFIAKQLDYTTFLTQYQRKHYFTNVGFRPEKYVVVPNVIFVQEVTREDVFKKRESLKKELQAEYLTSYVGRLIPSKNIEDTIKITALANKSGFNLGCVLVGGYSDEYYTKLKQLIADLQIGDKVKFEGFVNIPSLYTGATDYTTTTTTHGEALPNLLIESYALGKVTFSSDIPQMQDLICNGVDGFTIPLADLNEWVKRMKEFCLNAEMRSTMECSARQKYDLNYSPVNVGLIYYNTYKSIL